MINSPRRFMNWCVFERSLLISCVLAMTQFSGTCRSQESSIHQPIHRFLSSTTTVVGWVDLSKVQVESLTEFLHQARVPGFASGTGPGASTRDELETVRRTLIQLDVRRMYWISDISGFSSGPQSSVLVTARPEGVALVLKGMGLNVQVDDGAVLVGTAEEIARIANNDGNPSPALLTSLSEVSDSHGLVVLKPTHAVAPVLGTLSLWSQDNTPRITKAVELMLQVKSISLSGELPPTRAMLRVQSSSNQSAADLAKLINPWVAELLKETVTPVPFVAEGTSVILKSASVAESLAILGYVEKLVQGNAPMIATNSLRQIALGMHNFHDVHGHFPPQSLVDSAGNRLLSWRVLILPYLGYADLYEQFHLNESWDSEHNRALLVKIPEVFRSSEDSIRDDVTRTRFTAPLTADSVMGRRGPGVRVRDIIDGTSNTMMVVQTSPEHAVFWTKPQDVPIDDSRPMESIAGTDADGFPASMCDGSVRFIPEKTDTGLLNALISISGREIVNLNDIR